MFTDGPHIFYRQNHLLVKQYHYDPSTHEVIEERIFSNPPTYFFPGLNKTINIPFSFSAPQDQWEGIRKIAVFGDIHGEFDLICSVLIKNGIMNTSFAWTFGDGHVVFCGDLFDRGNKVTECLWLVFLLEQEAEKHGGRVHFLLGNHELMAMENDTRYLSEKYFNLVHSFKMRYSDFFTLETVLGRWLRSRNTVIKIDDIVFVHGGLSKKVAKERLSIPVINKRVRDSLSTTINHHSTVFGSEGPFWYRGYLLNWLGHAPITEKETKEILHYYKAEKIVFAHTPTSTIKTIYDKLIAIDVALTSGEKYWFLMVEDSKISVMETML